MIYDCCFTKLSVRLTIAQHKKLKKKKNRKNKPKQAQKIINIYTYVYVYLYNTYVEHFTTVQMTAFLAIYQKGESKASERQATYVFSLKRHQQLRLGHVSDRENEKDKQRAVAISIAITLVWPAV